VLFFVGWFVGWQEQVRLKGTGRFWCLYCEAERDYQHREWRSQDRVLFVPLGVSGGEFVLCRACVRTFSLECLDPSSTALREELLADAPDFAIWAQLRAQGVSAPAGSVETASADEGAGAQQPSGPAADASQTRRSLKENLSARSSSRKH
jgi:hypothetical protein